MTSLPLWHPTSKPRSNNSKHQKYVRLLSFSLSFFFLLLLHLIPITLSNTTLSYIFFPSIFFFAILLSPSNCVPIISKAPLSTTPCPCLSSPRLLIDPVCFSLSLCVLLFLQTTLSPLTFSLSVWFSLCLILSLYYIRLSFAHPPSLCI